jgi:F0F1-type ATP synthase membrane subunit b/b'
MDDLNVSVIIAQLINFGVLFYIFYYFLGKKIIETIEARRIKLQNLDNSDSVVKEKLDKAQVEVDQMISD